MITKESAQKTLNDSIASLKAKKGSVSLQDVETETINNACLSIITSYKSAITSVHDVNKIGLHIAGNVQFLTHAKFFTDHAKTLYPGAYTQAHADAANRMIIQNITWAGMWD